MQRKEGEIVGLRGDIIMIDDPKVQRVKYGLKGLAESMKKLFDSPQVKAYQAYIRNGAFVNPPYTSYNKAQIWVNGDYMGMQIPHWLDPGVYYDKEKERNLFGRIEKDWQFVGQLRKQKKAPHKQVLYMWVPDGAILGETKNALRSINNCSNEQLQVAIQRTGLALESHYLDQPSAELILDMCYAELQSRMDWTAREKAKQREGSQEDQK